jgi:hypothetical protein
MITTRKTSLVEALGSTEGDPRVRRQSRRIVTQFQLLRSGQTIRFGPSCDAGPVTTDDDRALAGLIRSMPGRRQPGQGHGHGDTSTALSSMILRLGVRPASDTGVTVTESGFH